ncbi:DNA double-strand break repair nuclease NurA [Acetohalobium arabaticum]|uniref:NurA domain protein n=1 Tax=Acetohalobium arabaticum (strain ATCC 49924 / DSM 5501 / Z-7288) TaxID=574087 RepID=D9QSR5_ACEAZ|nr:DNA double-strand break repair nuclease NurA [Acetohalobium arabaticum]ADL11603.1 NurA domain protein [Acetohalobium arabaticum DSM 5501]
MLEVSAKLKEDLTNANQELQQKYSKKSGLNKQDLRAKIKQKLSGIIKLNQMSEDSLEAWTDNRVIVGVDGSVNKLGSNYPHYLCLLQALAKSTAKEDIIETELFCPLVSSSKEEINKFILDQQQQGNTGISKQYAANKIKISKLAELELEVALQAIKEWQPKLIMLDGSLIRYRIEAEEKWSELKETAISQEILLVGVIEEIGTQEVGKEVDEELAEFYDRELLFGVLNRGEMLTLEFKRSLKTVFLRTSRDPQVIGLDILEEQQSELQNMAELIYTLTPEDSRGIPIWLDVVDHEVRISDKMMESLIDAYLDSSLKKRLFASKREERVY